MDEMRWTIRVIVVIAVLWAASFAWPYLAVRGLVTAVQSRDVAAINERVNFAALRRSLTEQIFRTYLRLTGREARLGQFRDLAMAATGSIADPMVARLISAEALVDLLATGWPTAVLPEKLPAFQGLRSGSLGNAWQLFANSEHGVRTFSLAVPANAPDSLRFRLQFRLTAWTWKLSAVELPEEIKVRLTQELIKALEKK